MHRTPRFRGVVVTDDEESLVNRCIRAITATSLSDRAIALLPGDLVQLIVDRLSAQQQLTTQVLERLTARQGDVTKHSFSLVCRMSGRSRLGSGNFVCSFA